MAIPTRCQSAPSQTSTLSREVRIMKRRSPPINAARSARSQLSSWTSGQGYSSSALSEMHRRRSSVVTEASGRTRSSSAPIAVGLPYGRLHLLVHHVDAAVRRNGHCRICRKPRGCRRYSSCWLPVVARSPSRRHAARRRRGDLHRRTAAPSQSLSSPSHRAAAICDSESGSTAVDWATGQTISS